ncbi:hypothetical protein Dimus_003092 [Dionaea muscipula]
MRMTRLINLSNIDTDQREIEIDTDLAHQMEEGEGGRNGIRFTLRRRDANGGLLLLVVIAHRPSFCALFVQCMVDGCRNPTRPTRGGKPECICYLAIMEMERDGSPITDENENETETATDGCSNCRTELK